MNGNKSYNVAHDKKRAQFDRDTLRNETKQNIIITKQFPKHLIIKKNEHLPALQRGAPAVGGQGGKPETKQKQTKFIRNKRTSILVQAFL